MERIRVDFNRRGKDGVLLSSMSRATGVVSAGDLVTVFQPGEDDMDATAFVVSVAKDGKLLLAVLEADQYVYTPTDVPLWRSAATDSTFGSARRILSPNLVGVPA